MIPILYGKWRRNRFKRLARRAGKQTQQLGMQSAIKALFYIILILSTHTFAMMQFEGFTFGDSLWLTPVSYTHLPLPTNREG